MSIPIQEYTFPPFRGLNFKDAPLNTPPSFARRAEQVDFDLLGAVSKANGIVKINAAQIAANPAVRGIYEYIQTDGDKFFIVFTSNGKFYKLDYGTGAATDITPSNVSLVAGSRPHFFTYNNLLIMGDGIGRPIYVSGAVTSASFFFLGLTAPITTLSAAAGAVGNLNGTYSYKVVYTNTFGGQSNASAISNIVTPVNQQVNLTLIPVNANPAENVNGRDIYRTVAGGAVYYFLQTLANNVTTTFIDNILDTSLGERLVEEKEVPPAGLWGFTEYNNSLYGFIKDTHDLRFTQINEAEAWGAFNIEPIVPGDGRGLTGLGMLNRLNVFKPKSIDTWEGVPGLFRRIRRSKKVGCVAHNTIKNVDLPNEGGEVLFFLSHQGVYMFDEQDPYYISREIETIFNGKDNNYVFNTAQSEKAVAEYSTTEKKYYLSIPVNGSSENNLLLVYDVYAQSWSVRPIDVASLTIRTTSDGLETIAGGEARSDATFGGFVYTMEQGNDLAGLDYKGEYATAWNPLNFPNNVKLLRYLELDLITQGEFTLMVDIYTDGSEIPALTKAISLSTGGGTWDISLWDDATFASDTYITEIMGFKKINARNVSIGIRTDEKDKPWKVLAMRLQHQPLPPAGERK